MKTEFLKGLGLEDDAIKQIMAENGKDVGAAKAELAKVEGERDNYKSQLDTATAELGKFKDVKPDELQATIEKLQDDLKVKDDEYAQKEADRLFNDGLKESISKAGGRNAKAIMAMLDVDSLKKSQNQSDDIKSALETIKESDAYLFGSDEPFKNPITPTGGNGGGDTSLAAMRAAAGLSPVENK